MQIFTKKKNAYKLGWVICARVYDNDLSWKSLLPASPIHKLEILFS